MQVELCGIYIWINGSDYNPKSIIKFLALIRHVAVNESQFTFQNLVFSTVKLCSHDWGI